jgi:hypothetical protein
MRLCEFCLLPPLAGGQRSDLETSSVLIISVLCSSYDLVFTYNLQTVSDSFFTKTRPSCGPDAGCAARLLVIYFVSVELVPVLSYFGKKDLIIIQHVFS